MPIQSRCPSCAAAVPTGAAWCSLCHADLRARREPRAAAHPVDDVLPDLTGATRSGGTEGDEPVGRREAGRHAKQPAPVGRRQAGARVDTIDRSADLEGLDIPTGEVRPEQVDELADQMLARLAVTERRQRMFDPDDVPGGRWTVALVGGTLTLLLMLSVFAVLGALLSR
ncbi:hypothetical protein [Longivirga aurantiaca]|uniref:Zinc ribbon domain-containing protein n=1 Tax=Longivirga aurantiaca TaxID=1837743 RepID=A0ABW1T2R9_9ACTN